MQLTEEKKQTRQEDAFWEAEPENKTYLIWKEKIERDRAMADAQLEQQRLMRERIQRDMEYQDLVQNSIRYFMTETKELSFGPKERTSSAELYDRYCKWCEEQGIYPEAMRTFCLHLKKRSREYKIAPTNFVWQGRHIRGFRGVALTEEKHA